MAARRTTKGSKVDTCPPALRALYKGFAADGLVRCERCREYRVPREPHNCLRALSALVGPQGAPNLLRAIDRAAARREAA